MISIVTSQLRVPNLQPSRHDVPYRLAIVGEAPGEHEVSYNQPFVGPSGQLLTSVLADCGVDRHACFLGNLCQVRPPGNDIARFSWSGPELTEGVQTLEADLSTFSPNLLLLLGTYPLWWAKTRKLTISDWRGSLLSCDAPAIAGRKAVATFHPAFVLRDFSTAPLFRFDLTRAVDEAHSPKLVLPQRDLITTLDADRMTYLLDTWPSGLRCSIDIEGGLKLSDVHPAELAKNAKRPPAKRRSYGWPCVSVSASPSTSYTIAWSRYNEHGHAKVLRAFARLMRRSDVPKVLQNSLYDNFVLGYSYGIPINPVIEDTMLKGWEIYSELPKGLGTQASIWTREPFYKFERKSSDPEDFFRYCAKDSAVTLEICNAQDSVLSKESRQHYDFNVSLLNPLLYMEHRGMRYNVSRAAELRAERVAEQLTLRKSLEDVAGISLCGPKGALVPQRLTKILYTVKNYPPQYKKENGRKTTTLTSDVEALLTLKRHSPHDTFLDGLLRFRWLEGQIETLSITTDPDGRVRCGYNVVGTETGRLTCYTSPTGSGANLTTVTKSLRELYLADSDYDFSQNDLEGADGWTVAARCASLGDSTMLDDYLAGIKPAKIIALLYHFGPAINELSRADLKWFHDRIFPIVAKLHGPWLYMGCKRVQHGTNYLMGIPTMIKQVLLDSYKYAGNPLYIEHAVASRLQSLYLIRYRGIYLWHQWAEAHLRVHGTLTSASGQTRQFFGRRFGKDIKDTLKEFLAHEPQANTTYATNLALHRLYYDPTNRRSTGALVTEPLHQVHDALCCQWPITSRDWARDLLRRLGNNPLVIAGVQITIPFDGTYGPSWGEQPHKV